MFKYKVVLANKNRDVIEFKSKYHLSMLHPLIYTHNNYFVYFRDAEVGLDLTMVEQLEIDDKVYKVTKTYIKEKVPYVMKW